VEEAIDLQFFTDKLIVTVIRGSNKLRGIKKQYKEIQKHPICLGK
jgi:Trp operon repressor